MNPNNQQPIQNDSEFKICAHPCDQCLFSRNRIVPQARANQIVKNCLKKDRFFECHKFTILGLKVVCRGFWDRHKRDVWPLRVAQMLIEAVMWMEPPKG